jgi:hypothetical protein
MKIEKIKYELIKLYHAPSRIRNWLKDKSYVFNEMGVYDKITYHGLNIILYGVFLWLVLLWIPILSQGLLIWLIIHLKKELFK